MKRAPSAATDSFDDSSRPPRAKLTGAWRRPVTVLALAFWLALIGVVGSSGVAADERSGRDPRLDQLRAHIRDSQRRAHIPGLSVAVVDDFQLVWSEGFGVCEAGSPRPVTEHTRFQAASISKPVTALAVMRWVQSKRLDLDQPVNEVLQSWKIPENDLTRATPVTLRQLLCHGAGLTVSGFPGYTVDAPRPTLLEILEGKPPANTPAIQVDLAPGTQFRYSGGGYTVLQQLIEDQLEQPFARVLDELVFDPLEMKESAFEQPPSGDLDNYASGHLANGTPVAGRWHVYPELAAAGLWTTPTDLARFAIELGRAGADQMPRLLETETAQEMFRPQVSANIGLGVFLRGQGQAARFLHSGGNQGFNCLLVATQSTGQGVVIMTNHDRGMLICDAIVRRVAELFAWPGAQPSGD